MLELRSQGDHVAVLSMGGAAGTVVQAAGKAGGKVCSRLLLVLGTSGARHVVVTLLPHPAHANFPAVPKFAMLIASDCCRRSWSEWAS